MDRLRIVPTLAAMKEGCVGCPVQVAKEYDINVGNMWVRLEGPGEFKIFSNLDLAAESMGLFTDVTISVYADQGEKLDKVMSSSQPGVAASRIFLPSDADGQWCSLYWVDGHGLFSLQTNKVVNGVPRLFNQRNQFFYYDTRDHNWKITTEQKWGAVSEQGETWSFDEKNKEHFTCSTGAEIRDHVAPLDKKTGHQCKKIVVPNVGVLTLDTGTVGYIHVYRNDKNFAYAEYNKTDSVWTWRVTSKEKWDAVSTGERWKFATYKRDELECFDGKRAFQMFGPGNCDTIFVNVYGLLTLRQDKMVNGMPTYWRNDVFMYFSFHEMQWTVAGKDEYHTAEASGESDGYRTMHKGSELSCKTGGEALASLLAPTCGSGAIDTLTFADDGTFFQNPQRKLNGMSTYESPHKHIAYYDQESSWRLTTPKSWQSVVDGSSMGYETFETIQIICGCKDAPKIKGFDGVTCADVKVGKEKYGNLKCNGAEYSDDVKTYCPETCNICKK